MVLSEGGEFEGKKCGAEGWDVRGRADRWERREASRAYVLDGDSRSAHRMSAESMIAVSGPSGAIRCATR